MAEKLSLLTELIKLAKIDKKHRDEEYRFMVAMAALMEVETDVLNGLFTEYAEFVPPKFEVDRILQFQKLVLLANVDLEVDQREIKMLKLAGLKMGLNGEAVNRVLDEMHKYEKGLVPAQRLIEIFKTYHN